jgi:hypothetical protein
MYTRYTPLFLLSKAERDTPMEYKTVAYFAMMHVPFAFTLIIANTRIGNSTTDMALQICNLFSFHLVKYVLHR